jgi:hypothetical protein
MHTHSFDANGSSVTEVVTNHDAGHIKFNADMESADKLSPIASVPDLAPLERMMAEFGITPADNVTVELTRAEATHLLALALQFQIVERNATVSLQVNMSAMRKLDGAL